MKSLHLSLLALIFILHAPVSSAGGNKITVIDSRAQPASRVKAQLFGFDQFGETVYASKKTPARRTMVFSRLPPIIVTAYLEYSDHSGALISSFSTSVNLDSPVTLTDPAMVDANDPVVSSFAFMGCNRVADGAGSDNLPSTANVANLIQDFAEIPDPALHSPLPTHLINVGDLVVSHVPGVSTLASQLHGWNAVYETTPLSTSTVQLVAVAGNHEMLQKVEQDGQSVEIQNPPTGEVFTGIMSGHIPAANGPTQAPPNLDGVARDESMLSFSFQTGNAFFIQLNTDTYTGDDSVDGIGLVPLYWLQGQLLQAQEDPAIQHVFVFGHKPIVGEDGVGETIAPSQLQEFTAMLCDPNGDGTTTKVRGYFTAHAHYWKHTQVDCPTTNGTLAQVLNGNGGTSPEQAFFMPPNGFFGYTMVSITQSGSVIMEARGRPVSSPDDAPGQPQSTIREYRTLTQ